MPWEPIVGVIYIFATYEGISARPIDDRPKPIPSPLNYQAYFRPMYTTQSTLLHNFKNSLKRTVCIEVTKKFLSFNIFVASFHEFRIYESTIFFSQNFSCFAFKTRYDFSIEIKNLAKTVHFHKQRYTLQLLQKKTRHLS